MVSRREKLSRSYFRLREQTFHKQIAVLSSSDLHKNATSSELNALRQANHGSNIYDTMYSRGGTCLKEEFEQIVQVIGGFPTNTHNLKVRVFFSIQCSLYNLHCFFDWDHLGLFFSI